MASIDETAIVSVGDSIKVRWPSDEYPERKATVIQVQRSDKLKHGSWFKYFLEFSDNGERSETRLRHLTFRMKKREVDFTENMERPLEPRHKKNKTANEKPAGPNSAESVALVSPISHIMNRPGQQPWRIPVHKYICAPMVGASELAFRLLCRRYGCQLAYTPMISSARFAIDEEYRKQEFQTVPEDRPLVCHFSANDPAQMLQAARYVEHRCDAIDLNLGCPQRVAFVGHYGSFLLDEADRPLVLSIVRTMSDALSIPIFVKIRLLDTIEKTVELCQQLADAGAALIAIHARYRVNLVDRTGPGARDGPAFLDQVAVVRKALPSRITLIANGNIREHKDLQANLELTGATGVMSAEGLLDNPAIFSKDFHNKDRLDLATEYLDLVKLYPVPMKCLVFHIRRMARDQLNAYQMMEECVSCKTPEEVRAVVDKCIAFRDTGNYEFDPMKEIRQKKELERRKLEEGKRKRYEERMSRKAKREGKDANFYLSQGAEVPTIERLKVLRAMSKEMAFEEWKKRHSQHCYDFHFNPEKCSRDRTCAFLHADPAFVSGDAELFG